MALKSFKKKSYGKFACTSYRKVTISFFFFKYLKKTQNNKTKIQQQIFLDWLCQYQGCVLSGLCQILAGGLIYFLKMTF